MLQMSNAELIVALQAFGATLAFVTVCLGLTKAAVETGLFKKT